MERQEIRTTEAGRASSGACAPGLGRQGAAAGAGAVADRECWIARMVTEFMQQRDVFSDVRLNESDVQRDLSYGCD